MLRPASAWRQFGEATTAILELLSEENGARCGLIALRNVILSS